MSIRRRGRVLAALLSIAEPCGAAGAIAAAGLAGGAVFLVVTDAEAQAWGVSRRTARRTSRRVSRRHDYYGGAYGGAYGGYYGGVPYLGVLPAGYRTVVVGEVTYYEVEGVRYVPKIVEGQTVYVEVQ